MPSSSVDMPKNVTRRFWLTVKVPVDTAAGVYRGTVRIATQRGPTHSVPLEFTVHTGVLDPVDVPAGPWGHTINLPWASDSARDSTTTGECSRSGVWRTNNPTRRLRGQRKT